MKPKIFFYVLLGVLVVIVGLGGAGYYYGMKYIHTQSDQLAVQLAEQKVADDEIDQLAKLGSKYQKEIVPILPLIDNTLPRNKKQSEILAQIERLANNNGMQVVSVQIPPPAGLPSSVSQTMKAGTVLELPINFYVKGSYVQLETFTSQLENLNRFTNISKLDLAHDVSDGANAKYTFNLNAYIKP